MAELYKTNAGLKLVKTFGEATKTKEESKHVSPGKSVSSEDTRESAASSADAKEENLVSSVDAKEEELPDFIRRKRTYSEVSTEADEQLWEDIRKEHTRRGGSFLDQKFLKYTFIDAETREAYVKMPTIFHQRVVKMVRRWADGQSNADNGVLVETDGGIELTTGSRKEPDVYIFGRDRTEYDDYGVLTCRSHQYETETKEMNPSAIIEVSWTNKLKDELEKFALEMNQCNSDELGAIKVGYLIKFIPKKTGMYPTKDHREHPLVGIDVYRMKAGDAEPAPDDKFRSWRYGDTYPEDLEITGDELGQDNQGTGISIPFKILVGGLAALGVSFERSDEN